MSTLVVLSGGMDSATALGHAVRHSEQVGAISFAYGQRHLRELESAARVAKHYGVPLRTFELTGLLSGSALLGESDVPHGRYDAPSMVATVVPGRNLLFAAAAVAQVGEADRIVFGVHAGDHPIYPDCRPEFWSALAGAAAFGYRVTVLTPFLRWTKAAIAKYASDLGVPLGLTWSCYEGGIIHCGRCGTCVERAEAFELAGVPDPTEYEDPDYWREAVNQ